jgi:hypothetical protein
MGTVTTITTTTAMVTTMGATTATDIIREATTLIA